VSGRRDVTVLFVHGARVTPLYWRCLAPLFVDRGYRTLAPAWPLKNRPVSEHLSHPNIRFAKVGIPAHPLHQQSRSFAQYGNYPSVPLVKLYRADKVAVPFTSAVISGRVTS